MRGTPILPIPLRLRERFLEAGDKAPVARRLAPFSHTTGAESERASADTEEGLDLGPPGADELELGSGVYIADDSIRKIEVVKFGARGVRASWDDTDLCGGKIKQEL